MFEEHESQGGRHHDESVEVYQEGLEKREPRL